MIASIGPIVVGVFAGICVPVWWALAILTLRDSSRRIEAAGQSFDSHSLKSRITSLSAYNPVRWLVFFLAWPHFVFSRRPQ
jgi:hypothetical protein